MKQGSILLNVGRGTSVDTEALCDAVINPNIFGWYNLEIFLTGEDLFNVIDFNTGYVK